jgi:hypothetical protein
MYGFGLFSLVIVWINYSNCNFDETVYIYGKFVKAVDITSSYSFTSSILYVIGTANCSKREERPFKKLHIVRRSSKVLCSYRLFFSHYKI